MSKETLSIRQANRIVEQVNQILRDCKSRMEDKNDEFVEKVSTIWEDKNAVEYMKIHKQNFEQFIEELGKNNQTFANTVKDIATMYAKAAGMSVAVTATAGALVGRINIAKVKEYFSNSENADDFGFQNPDAGAAQVMDAFTELKSALESMTTEAVNRIRSINAFGNETVQRNLAESAGKIVSILNSHIGQAENQIRNFVDQTAQSYIKIGASAVTAAALKASEK